MPTQEPFCLLVIASEIKKKWLAADARRIYGPDAPTFANDPIEALTEIIDRHGLEFEVDGRKVRFSPFARIKRPDSQDPQAIIGALGIESGRSFTFAQSMRMAADELHIAWAYFIDEDSYKADTT